MELLGWRDPGCPTFSAHVPDSLETLGTVTTNRLWRYTELGLSLAIYYLRSLGQVREPL